MLTRILAFPWNPPHQWIVERYGPVFGADIYTRATVPALVGMQYDRRFALNRIGDENIRLTNINAFIASGTYFGVKHYWTCSAGRIGSGVNDIFFP